MARTPLFRYFSRIFRHADAANQKNVPKEETERFFKLSRRQFMGVAAGAIVFPALTHSRLLRGRGTQGEIAIIGGGFAGLTAAYRLGRAGLSSKVYEASPRWGGRAFTKDNFNSEKMFCELGGELVDTGHADLIALCGELGVALEDFEVSLPALAKEIYFFDGKMKSEAELLEAFRPVAKIIKTDLDRAFGSAGVSVPTYQHPIAGDLDRTSLRQYFQQMQSSCEGWVLKLLEQAYIGEYGLDLHAQSALNLLLMIRTNTEKGFSVFGDSDESKRIKGGSSRLADALRKSCADSDSGRLHPDHRLVKIEDRKNAFRLTFKTAGGLREVKADRVVLALPFSVLRDVAGIETLDLSPVKKIAIAETQYGTNAKFMLGFKNPFWRKVHGAIPACEGTVFSDSVAQQFWDSSRLQKGHSGILTAFFGGKIGTEITGEKLDAILRDVSRIIRKRLANLTAIEL